jgi:hypothetical protein
MICHAISFIYSQSKIIIHLHAEVQHNSPKMGDTAMDRIERVARAMCKADGGDPDHLIHAKVEGETGSGLEPGQKPNWTSYERQARLFLAGLEAVKE